MGLTVRARRLSLALWLACLLWLLPPARAEVRLPEVLGDNMVLQRERPAPIWGTAKPGEGVAVTVNYGGEVQK
jgi:sialate O-acetylesterase